MPPKGKDAKKGAPVGNYKAGKLMKDILPPNTKPPREGAQIKVDGEPDIQRQYAYEPYTNFPEWGNNEDAKNHDFTHGIHRNDDGSFIKFEDNTPIFLPPSFKEFEKNDIQWLRPEEYLREIAYDQEMAKRKQEKKLQIKKKKTMRKQSILSIGQAQSVEDSLSQINNKVIGDDKKDIVNKEELQFDTICIGYDQRLETEEEVKKRKDEAEKLAALDKNAKKKPPAKGQAAQTDPMDEPQLIKVPVENTMDMGFLMPVYSKWATSQFQFIKDRSIRDCESRESIWQRIYPQENGIPVLSPSGKYWVKVKFMGKERLVEIDDKMPCDAKKKLMLPRSINNFEIWPQILMKAILKVYSYKWFSPQAQYDQEVGDGSIVYSMTGLIPEPISIKDFEKDGIELMRKVLSDDHYFNKKTYVTCYCDNEHRPKLPSQATTLKKIDFGPNAPGAQNSIQDKSSLDVDSEPSSGVSVTSSGRMLNRLRDVASMAISVTTGRKLNISSKNSTGSNVITGFGYALMDIFENQFVDMDSIVKKNDEIEEVKSPFISPARKKRDKTVSKDDWKKKRREEKKREQEERDRREREPPKQYKMIKIKTSVGHYPVMNYLSTFTNDEVTEGKRCLLNRIRRPFEVEKPESPTSKVQHLHKHHQGFQLNVQALDTQNQNETYQDNKAEEEKKPLIEPKTRAAGGVWLLASDFPHSFQHMIIYHNMNKYNNIQTYQDKWVEVSQPYISNEKDVVIKLELDEELVKQMNQHATNMNSLDISKQSHNNSMVQDHTLGADESKIDGASHQLLPGEVIPNPINPDQVLIGFAPFPSKEPLPVLPRYLMRLQQLDGPDSTDQSMVSNQTNQMINHQTNHGDRPIDLIFKSYLEGKLINMNGQHAENNCIWLKPNIVAPLGFTIWAAGLVRKISIVPRSEYLIHQKQFYLKSYQSEFLPIEKGKYHLFGKYDFQVHDQDLIMNLKVDIPNDKYLLKYLRMKIIDKNDVNRKYPTQTEHELLLNSVRLENMLFSPNNGKGYSVIIEGFMPYNTTEGQLQLEVLTNRDNFSLEEVQHVEPLEYSDKYFPSKYGIIFKEKVYIGPDHTSAAINIKLKKEGREFDKIEGMQKLFKIQVLDHGQVIYQKEGYNQITISHFMFRSSHQLPEHSDNPDDETKHQYVIQALFDLYEWPDCKTENELSADLTWHFKIYSSETLAIVKDTDKEDRERALKASWEQAELGRAEKAKRSRLKFLYQQMLARGEELNEEQKAIAMEVRERIRKKDEPEQPVKGGKGAPAKGGPPAKGAPAKGAPAKGAPAQAQPDEEDEKNKKPLPEPDQHVNNEIRNFLLHYKSDRLIHITCDKSLARQRSEQEKQAIAEQRQKEREQAQIEQEQEAQRREQHKEQREKFKEQVFKQDIEVERQKYKERMTQIMGERNKYRDMIAARKEKDKNLQDLIAQDKIDLPALTKTIEEARENLVREEVITKGEKYLAWLKYCKELEQMLQQALAEKVKENLAAIIERIEREQIVIEPKMLNDAKNNLAKMK